MSSLLQLISKYIKMGVPLPLLRDIPKDIPSISYTMTYASGLLALLSCSEQASKLLGNLNASSCLELFIASSVLYVGRGVLRSKDGKTFSLLLCFCVFCCCSYAFGL